MEREEKIKELIKLVEFVEGVNLTPEYFKDYSIEKIESKIDFYEYVSEK